MNEQQATMVLQSVATYLNLSRLDDPAMHTWLFRRVLGCDPPPYDVEDRQMVNLLFSAMATESVSVDGKEVKVREVTFPKTTVSVCYGQPHDFKVKHDVSGILFMVKVASMLTASRRASQCELCTRLFFAARNSAKYCCNACRVQACNIRSGKKKTGVHSLWFPNMMKPREIKILKMARNECKRQRIRSG